MEIVNKTVSTVKNNFVGAIVGAGLGFLANKKVIKSDKTWVKIVSVVVGAALGATAQSKFFAKKGAPSAASVKK